MILTKVFQNYFYKSVIQRNKNLLVLKSFPKVKLLLLY